MERRNDPAWFGTGPLFLEFSVLTAKKCKEEIYRPKLALVGLTRLLTWLSIIFFLQFSGGESEGYNSAIQLFLYWFNLRLILFFLQISSNGAELKLMACDHKVVKVTLDVPVSPIFKWFIFLIQMKSCSLSIEEHILIACSVK